MKTPPVKQNMIKQHVLKNVTILIYPNIIVCEFKEGVHVDFEQASFPIQVAQLAFGNEKPMIYISHRKNSYSWDPVHYREIVGLFPNLIAFAVVSENKERRTPSVFESHFTTNPIASFKTLDEAIKWAEKLLASAN